MNTIVTGEYCSVEYHKRKSFCFDKLSIQGKKLPRIKQCDRLPTFLDKAKLTLKLIENGDMRINDENVQYPWNVTSCIENCLIHIFSALIGCSGIHVTPKANRDIIKGFES